MLWATPMTWPTHLLVQGVPLVVVRDMLGHTQISATADDLDRRLNAAPAVPQANRHTAAEGDGEVWLHATTERGSYLPRSAWGCPIRGDPGGIRTPDTQFRRLVL